MPEPEEPKKVSNNDLRNAQFGGGLINAETVNAQRIGGDIWNVFFGQQTTPVGNPNRPKNEWSQRKEHFIASLSNAKEEIDAGGMETRIELYTGKRSPHYHVR